MDPRLMIAQAKYREAWDEYMRCSDPERAKQLEKAMDSAQDGFSNEEFREFARTLNGWSNATI